MVIKTETNEDDFDLTGAEMAESLMATAGMFY